ncbi:MAG: hypothetical protein AB1894_26790 [Chloroflexota bacterium]
MRSRDIILVAMLCLSGCSIYLPKSSPMTARDNCIPPIVTFAFPLYSKERRDYSDQKHILPGAPWDFVANMPESTQENSGFGSILFARSKQGYDEIWIIRGSELLVFNTENNSWKPIDGQIKGTGKTPMTVFLAKDGSIWGAGMRGLSYDQIPILSRFQEDEGTFEFVLDGDNRLIENTRILRTPLIDQRGMFWLIINYNQLYGFNPTTKEAQLYTDTTSPLLSSKMALAPDGTIYILSMGLGDSRLLHYDPSTNSAMEEPILLESPGESAFDSLFMDRSGRLWFHDFGWMNQEHQWYRIIRSPLFISDRTEYRFQYLWENPDIVFESSNDLLWFLSSMGTTWLNPEDGEWCRVTTYPSRVVEDQENNLWILAYNKLYKLQLEP